MRTANHNQCNSSTMLQSTYRRKQMESLAQAIRFHGNDSRVERAAIQTVLILHHYMHEQKRCQNTLAVAARGGKMAILSLYRRWFMQVETPSPRCNALEARYKQESHDNTVRRYLSTSVLHSTIITLKQRRGTINLIAAISYSDYFLVYFHSKYENLRVYILIFGSN